MEPKDHPSRREEDRINPYFFGPSKYNESFKRDIIHGLCEEIDKAARLRAPIPINVMIGKMIGSSILQGDLRRAFPDYHIEFSLAAEVIILSAKTSAKPAGFNCTCIDCLPVKQEKARTLASPIVSK